MKVLSATALVVALDQLTKYLIRVNFDVYESVSVLGNFFKLTFVENRGIVFGIGVGGALPIFTALSLVATGAILYFLYKEIDSPLGIRLSLAIILGGAIGNAIDRVMWQKVVDFLDFGIGTHRFYIFNVADTAVTVGVGLYLLTDYLHGRNREQSPEPVMQSEPAIDD